MAVLDQYKQIQESIQQRQPTENQLAKAKYYGYTEEQISQAMQQYNALQPATPVAPTQTPQPVTTPQQPQQAPAPAPQPEVKPTGITTPQAEVEKNILSPNVTGMNPNQMKLEQANLNKLNSNLSIYSTGKSLYDAVQGGSILPGTKEFTDLTTRNPQVLAEYNAIKADKVKTDTIKVLGQSIVGQPIQTPPSNALEQLVSFFTKSMDTDVATEYQNSVINNPAYQASIQNMNGINQQIAENNNNINALRNDVRQKYSAGAPESLIASAIAREARPLIEQGQYLAQLQQNAQSEMTRLFEENKQVFDLKQEERNQKTQRMIDLYGTIRQEEIRQEDFARADQRLQEEYDRADKKDEATLKRLEQERIDNVKTAIAQLGVDPTGETYDDLLSEYASAIANQPKEDKITTGLKAGDYYLDNGVLKQVPPGGGGGTNTAPAPNRTPTISSSFNNGVFTVNIENGATPRKSARGFYECGMLVNDTLGISMADLHEDKLKYNNSSQPIVGGAFIEKTNDKYGHTGIIESINPNGTLNIVETNYPVGSGVSRKTIDPNDRNIVGYYNPQTAGTAPISAKAQNIIDLLNTGANMDDLIKGSSNDAQALRNEVYAGLKQQGGYTKQALELFQDGIRVAQKFLDEKDYNKLGGWSSKLGGQFTPEYGDARERANQISAIIGKDNLGLMKGVLTDADRAFLVSMASGFREGSFMSDTMIKENIEIIKAKLEAKLAGGVTAIFSTNTPEDSPNPTVWDTSTTSVNPNEIW